MRRERGTRARPIVLALGLGTVLTVWGAMPRIGPEAMAAPPGDISSRLPAAPLAGPAEGPAGSAAPPAVLFRGGTIWTMAEAGVIENGSIILRDGKIAKIGRDLRAPSGALIVDIAGKHLTPGLIDAHSHTAAEGGLNEGSHNITAEVRVRDVLDADDIAIYRQLAGGLTTANVLHGSANSIGGQNAVIKLRWGHPASELLFEEAPAGIKFALGENPKRSNFSRPGMERRYPATRMGVANSIRRAFLEARDYQREWKEYETLPDAEKERREPPRRDLQLEAIGEILDGKRMVHAHSYRQDEILMLIRVAEEFGFRIAAFQHVLEGYKVADEIASHGAGASTFSDWWAYKAEAFDAIPHNGALMTDRGVVVSFNSDSSELARRLNLEAAKGVKYGGLSEEKALALVTINPARQLGVEKWAGSLEPGKHGNIAVWSGHPLSTYSICEQTWVDGVKQFDREEDLRRREEMEEERAVLIEKVKNADKPKAKKEEGEEEAEGKPGEENEAAEEGSNEDEGSEDAEPQPAGHPAEYRLPRDWRPGTFALAGATVHTLAGPDIPGGSILVRDGRIAAVGEDVEIPAGTEVVDLRGLHVYPGMIDADTVLGLTEIGSVTGMRDIEEIDVVNPSARAEIAINPDSELIPVTRANGITHVLTAPRGGVISGTSALVRLDGWTWEDLSAAAPLAMHLQYPTWQPGFSFATFQRETEEEVKKKREKALEDLGKAFSDARAYKLAMEAEGKGGRRTDRDPALEAMLPVLDGSIPVIVHARELRQIKGALDWAEKENVRIIVAGGDDAWRVAGRLARREVPVILGPVLRNPSRRHEPYDTPFTAAKRLHEAGVSFCIAGGGSSFNASSTRNLPYHAAMAAAFGLPREEALKAVTLYPARILGVGDDLGSIEAGKSASFMVTDGDPLEIRTSVARVFIDGKEADMMNRHQRLYEKYASRPRRETAGTGGLH